jgi:zinc finger CCHC domain-containing protein 8
VVNIQDAGQERWKKKYVYWIPALHLEGTEVAKGRWGAGEVNRALDEWEERRAKGSEVTTANVSPEKRI